MLARTVLMLSMAEVNTGELDASLRHARKAVTLAEQLGVPALTSQTLTNWVFVSFQHGPRVG